jgi:hypothetical protein
MRGVENEPIMPGTGTRLTRKEVDDRDDCPREWNRHAPDA